jgi:Uma2 family endonuclease
VTRPDAAPQRYTVRRYLALVRSGVLRSDDPVELLDGLIVAEPPANPPHASATCRIEAALRATIGERALVRVQQPFEAGRYSLPEPDVAVVPGSLEDYDTAHPREALLVVEVADSSLPQDRLTKLPIYAVAGVPEYWIVNLAERCVEVFRRPWPKRRRYAVAHVARAGEVVNLAAVDQAWVAVDDLLPRRRVSGRA